MMFDKLGTELAIGRELNKEIIEEMKQLELCFSLDKDFRKELNKERIEALGMYLVKDGKYV